MRRVALAVGAAMLLTPAAAPAQSGRSDAVASALESDPVFVAPARAEQLPAAAAGRIRLRILRKDIGRIKIAVVPGSWAKAEGGVRAFANAIDADLQARGALLVVADGDAFVVTSHEHATDAATGVQRAFDGDGGLELHLRRSVDALAEIDPGPSGDVGQSNGAEAPPGAAIPGFPDPNRIVDTIDDGIRFTFIAVIGVVVGTFLLVGFLLWRRYRQAHEEDEEVFEDAMAAAREERVALGDDIVDLDVATSMPNVPAPARAAYERALDAYDRSDLALDRADSRRRLDAARKLIADGRAAAAQARRSVGA